MQHQGSVQGMCCMQYSHWTSSARYLQSWSGLDHAGTITQDWYSRVLWPACTPYWPAQLCVLHAVRSSLRACYGGGMGCVLSTACGLDPMLHTTQGISLGCCMRPVPQIPCTTRSTRFSPHVAGSMQSMLALCIMCTASHGDNMCCTQHLDCTWLLVQPADWLSDPHLAHRAG